MGHFSSGFREIEVGIDWNLWEFLPLFLPQPWAGQTDAWTHLSAEA